MLYNHPTLFLPESNLGNPIDSSIEVASATACNFSSWDVTSVDLKEEADIVWADDLYGLRRLEDVRLLPYLEGFRTGILRI